MTSSAQPCERHMQNGSKFCRGGTIKPSQKKKHGDRGSVLLRAAEATELIRGDGGEGHLADGDARAVERGGEARRAHAAAPGADGEEVVVVVPLGGGAVRGRRGGRRDVAAGEPRERGEGGEAAAAVVVEPAAELEGPARGEGAG